MLSVHSYDEADTVCGGYFRWVSFGVWGVQSCSEARRNVIRRFVRAPGPGISGTLVRGLTVPIDCGGFGDASKSGKRLLDPATQKTDVTKEQKAVYGDVPQRVLPVDQ